MKDSIDLDSFDFGFSLVDADELQEVQQVRTELSETESTVEQWMQQAEQWKDKAQTIYRAIQPLLDNLSKDEDKEYIYWPGDQRVQKINAFKLKLMQILED